MDREWAGRLRLVAFEDYTVESIETVGTSQPKIAIRGLCQRCNYSRCAVFGTPRGMRELRNGPIALQRGRTRACKRKEKANLQRPNNVSRIDDKRPASSQATEICPSFARKHKPRGTARCNAYANRPQKSIAKIADRTIASPNCAFRKSGQSKIFRVHSWVYPSLSGTETGQFQPNSKIAKWPGRGISVCMDRTSRASLYNRTFGSPRCVRRSSAAGLQGRGSVTFR